MGVDFESEWWKEQLEELGVRDFETRMKNILESCNTLPQIEIDTDSLLGNHIAVRPIDNEDAMVEAVIDCLCESREQAELAKMMISDDLRKVVKKVHKEIKKDKKKSTPHRVIKQMVNAGTVKPLLFFIGSYHTHTDTSSIVDNDPSAESSPDVGGDSE